MDASILDSPLTQSATLPLAVSLVACGLVRLIGGPSRGPLVASVAVSIGFLAAYLTISGVPPFPPRASSQKLAYLTLAGAGLGLVLDSLRLDRGPSRGTMLVALGLGVGWLAWPKLRSFEPAIVLTVSAVWIGTATVLVRLYAVRARGSDGAMLLLVAALGLAAVSFLGRSASYAQLAAALAAATGGFMLWNWPVARFPFAAAGVLGAGGAFGAMATNVLLYTKASPIALALLLSAFFVDVLADRVPLPPGRFGQSLRPIVLAALASIPLAASIGVGVLSSG